MESALSANSVQILTDSMGRIGDICENPGEVTFEWKIKDFCSLSDDVDIKYESPKFYFCGTSWEMWVYPNGQTSKSSSGWISVYVIKSSTGFPLSITFSLDLKTADGEIHKGFSSTGIFHTKGDGYGLSKLLLKSIVTDKNSEPTSLDTLTVICTLKHNESQAIAGSLFCRQLEICDNLKEIFEKAKHTDSVLKIDGDNIPAHRIILETRSPVFSAMFNQDTKENATGEVIIEDMEKSALKAILEYMYCGDIDQLTSENVSSIYAAADKYDIKDVREMCLKFIKGNLSVEWVCDVITFANFYDIDEIRCCVREYFKENTRKILDTEKWKTFAKENHDTSVEFLTYVIKSLLPE